MQFKTISLSALALFFLPASLAITVSYDQTYDNAAQDLGATACSDGPNGLLPKGFTTLGSLPHFPNVGGAAAIAAWDSPSCGSCWQLTYKGRSINVLAVDHAAEGFNLALAAMNTLTDNQAEFLGRIDAEATQVDASQCGL